MGIKIMGIVSDGGGSDKNICRNMANNLPLIVPWPDVNSVSFMNPCKSNSTYLYLVMWVPFDEGSAK